MSVKHTREVVFVLGAHAKSSIPIIESCSKMGLHVIAGSEKKCCCGFFSRAVRERVVYPSPEHEPQACADFLCEFLKSAGVAVIFPTGDEMTDLVARHQDEFRQYTKLIMPPYDVFHQGRNKILTLKAAERAGCPIPKTWYTHEKQLSEIAGEALYPVLIKPAISAGARGITLCGSAQELLEKFPGVVEKFGDSYVQEYVPQTGMQYKVDAIVDDDQSLLAAVAYAKLRYYPATGGSSVLNRTEYRPDIITSVHRVLKELKWKGFCDFDFITDPRDGIVKLMEINPRYPESFRATVAAGIDMTKIMYLLAKGEKPAPQLAYAENRYLRFLFGDIMWFLTTKDNRWRTKPSFFSFFRSDTIDQLIRVRDPGIFIGYLLENISMFWDKEFRDFRLWRGN